MTTTKLITADELLLMPDNGFRQELVRGELIEMPPPGKRHGEVTMGFGAALYNYSAANDYGMVGDNYGYRWNRNRILCVPLI